ncbi:hypothetical protein [Pararhizobium mangrovi]|uniref:hypothetical protein n=1 Tax=Pararhizobium mangrovi TaxID=2590452 RepID=UPI0015E83FDE|nr:hypothetical protein [Pararhizobium mangrovi]
MTDERKGGREAFIETLAANGITIPRDDLEAAWHEAKRLRDHARRVRRYVEHEDG